MIDLGRNANMHNETETVTKAITYPSGSGRHGGVAWAGVVEALVAGDDVAKTSHIRFTKLL